jgi:siroheme synthase-like protein
VPFAYPVSLELRGRRAVVVGDEAVALGKVDGLLAAGARVTVIAEGPDAELGRLEHDDRVRVHRRGFEPSDLDGALLCVATDPDRAVRSAIYREAQARNVLVNMVDDIPRCDFAAPAIVRRGDLVIAVSTAGRSPALARRLREDLEERYGPEWVDVVEVLGTARDATLPALPDVGDRARRWRTALDLDEVVDLVRQDRAEEARDRLVRRLLDGAEQAAEPVGAPA